MIELQRHIEVLLLTNKCVVVPDFGGFILHAVAARYDREDRMFIPPYYTLGFNPQLRMNDSVLALSYVEAYDISYPEAIRRIEGEVKELKAILGEQGTYELNDLGTLSVNQEGSYVFEPCESGILSPELYGLGSVGFQQLEDSRPALEPVKDDTAEAGSTEEQAAPTLLEFTDSTDDETRVIPLKVSWVRNAVAIAAAVVAFFFIATPIANGNLGTRSMTQLQQHILYKLIPSDTNVSAVKAEPHARMEHHAEEAPVAKAADKAEEKSTEASAENAQENTGTASAKASTTTYYIVLASQVKKSNAELYVEQLHKQGYPAARVFIHHGLVRVICGEYASQAEAYNQLNKMQRNEDFADAWVYKNTEA